MFQIDGHTCTLDELIEANADTFTEEDVENLRALKPGEKITFGGGAWAEAEIVRVS